MTNTELLENKIAASGLKKSYIAKALGISAFGLAKKIKNETEFKTTEVKVMCDVLGISSLEERERIFFAQLVD